MAIDWTFLKQRGGENFEQMLATLIRRDNPNARQTNPDQGDGGIDIIAETPDGIRVWQAKAFTAPLTGSQQRQVARSWKRFWDQNVETGPPVLSYALVTPWTPTETRMQWFRDLTKDAKFEVTWEAEAYLNGLAAAHQDVVALYEKGRGAFDDHIMAKSVLAASAVGAEPETMFEALATREAALRDIRDSLHTNYLINVSERTSAIPGTPPTPSPTEVGLMHRMEPIGPDRWRVESVIPRNPDSTDIEPITGTVHFKAEPNTPEADAIDAFRLWGVALKDFTAEVETQGGPFAQPRHPARLSLGSPTDRTEPMPDLVLRLVDANDNEHGTVRIRITETTHGLAGGGVRLVGKSTFGNVHLEIRFGSTLADSEVGLTFPPNPGANPRTVLNELAWVNEIQPGMSLAADIDGFGTAMRFGNVTAPGGALLSRDLAAGLVALQPHTPQQLLMPHADQVTNDQMLDLDRMVRICAGERVEGRWNEMTLTLDDPQAIALLTEGPGARIGRQPAITLGSTEIRLNGEVLTEFWRPRLGPGVDPNTVKPGQTVTLVPGDDDRMVTYMAPSEGKPTGTAEP